MEWICTYLYNYSMDGLGKFLFKGGSLDKAPTFLHFPSAGLCPEGKSSKTNYHDQQQEKGAGASAQQRPLPLSDERARRLASEPGD